MPARRRLLFLFAGLYAAASVVYAGAWMYYVWRDPGVRLGLSWASAPAEGEGIVVMQVDPASPAGRAGLRGGDRIVGIDGVALDSQHSFLEVLDRRRALEVVTIDVRRGAEALAHEVVLAPRLARNSGFGFLAGRLINFYPLPFLIVGLGVLFLRVEDRHAWLLALLFGSFIASAPYFDREAIIHPALRGFGGAYKIALNGLTPGLFYAFFALVPAPSPLDRRLPWLKVMWLGVGGAVALPAALWCLLAGGSSSLSGLMEVARRPLAQAALLTYSFVPFLLGLASLFANARHGRNGETRRKARVMVGGTVAGLLPMILLFVTAAVLRRSPYSFPFGAWATCVLALTLWPLSFGYAVVRHRVLDLPVLLRRGARYLLVQRGFAVLVALVMVVNSLLVVWALSRVPLAGEWALPVGVGGGIAFGLGLAFSAAHVQRRIAERIDRAFFRSSYDARRILQDLAQKARTVASREALAALLDRHLLEALQPAWLVTYLARADGVLEAVGEEPVPLLPVLGAASRFLTRMQRSPRPVDLVEKSTGELGPLRDLGSECLVPLLGRGSSLLGLVVLGPRRSEEPYSGEDHALLGAVASQASLALEVISMAEEMAARLEAERRATRELEIARDVQRQLLPQRRPRMGTLDYAADCVQARVVGGDYWDVLDLGPGRLGLVLADISGKGISASLLMANLQASLRSRPPEAFDDLPRLVTSLNRHLLESTEASRYATLFVGVYEDATRQLRYANCGHVPPLLVRDGGVVERLAPTAPAVGLLEVWEAEAATVVLRRGDWLLLFTDGVTDAIDPRDREFGEERLLATVREAGAAPAEVLAAVFSAIAAWGAGASQWDDQTLVVARVG